MKISFSRKTLILFGSLFIATTLLEAATPGAKAPELKISKWIKKGPIRLQEGQDKYIYVLEFWATCFPSCAKAVPYLNFIQKKYRSQGVIVAAIANEPKKKINEFLINNNLIPEYALGVDDHGKTSKEYTTDINNIPVVFVIGKDGTILWQGQVFELERILSSIIAHKFDAAVQNKISSLQEEMIAAMQNGQRSKATAIAQKILALDPKNDKALQVTLFFYEQQGNSEAALSLLNKLISKAPEYAPLYFVKLDLLFRNSGDPLQIQIFSEQIQSHFIDQPEILNSLAWLLLNQQAFGIVPLYTALSAAKTSVKKMQTNAPKEQKAVFFTTLAKAYYSVGNIEKAIVIQQNVARLAKGTPQEQMANLILVYYKRALALGRYMK